MKNKDQLISSFSTLEEELDLCIESSWTSINGEDGLGEIIYYSLCEYLGFNDYGGEESFKGENKTLLLSHPNFLKEVEEYVQSKGVSNFDMKEVLSQDFDNDLKLPSEYGIKNEQNEKKDKKREYDRQNYLKKKKLNGTKLQKERNEKKDKKREYDKHNYLKKKKLKDTK